jgi:hypothetical protein
MGTHMTDEQMLIQVFFLFLFTHGANARDKINVAYKLVWLELEASPVAWQPFREGSE